MYFHKKLGSSFAIIIVYVDDILIGTPEEIKTNYCIFEKGL